MTFSQCVSTPASSDLIGLITDTSTGIANAKSLAHAMVKPRPLVVTWSCWTILQVQLAYGTHWSKMPSFSVSHAELDCIAQKLLCTLIALCRQEWNRLCRSPNWPQFCDSGHRRPSWRWWPKSSSALNFHSRGEHSNRSTCFPVITSYTTHSVHGATWFPVLDRSHTAQFVVFLFSNSSVNEEIKHNSMWKLDGGSA